MTIIEGLASFFRIHIGTECPSCHKQGWRVVSGGFPGKICPDDKCETGWGLAFDFHVWGWPFTGYMYRYEKAWGYPVALWHWLTTNDDDD